MEPPGTQEKPGSLGSSVHPARRFTFLGSARFGAVGFLRTREALINDSTTLTLRVSQNCPWSRHVPIPCLKKARSPNSLRVHRFFELSLQKKKIYIYIHIKKRHIKSPKFHPKDLYLKNIHPSERDVLQTPRKPVCPCAAPTRAQALLPHSRWPQRWRPGATARPVRDPRRAMRGSPNTSHSPGGQAAKQ